MSQLQDCGKRHVETISNAQVAFQANSAARGAVGKHISDLNEQAKQIKSSLKDIESISTQVKLLSLNASVEAARAGQYGKGFAVVAQEVSKLSESTRAVVTHIENTVTEMNKSIQSALSDMAQAKELGAGFDEKLAACVAEAKELSAIIQSETE